MPKARNNVVGTAELVTLSETHARLARDRVGELRIREGLLEAAVRQAHFACQSTLPLWRVGEQEHAPEYQAYRHLADGWRTLYLELDVVRDELRALTGEPHRTMEGS